jgi:hypothetical protein
MQTVTTINLPKKLGIKKVSIIQNLKMRERMKTYHIQTTVSNDGTLTIEGLPFQAGDKVEVIVRGRVAKMSNREPYPLHSKPIRYENPFESVAENAWEILK